MALGLDVQSQALLSLQHNRQYEQGGSTLGKGGGHVTPDSLIAPLPPDSKASWPFWRDFWCPKRLQNPNFSGLCPGPRSGSLERSSRSPSWWGGGSLPPPKNTIPALGPSGLVSKGLRV